MLFILFYGKNMAENSLTLAESDMQHFMSPWTIAAILAVALLSGRWEVLVVVLGVEFCSQSLHESRHHPDGWFANPIFRLLGIAVAGVGAYLLR